MGLAEGHLDPLSRELNDAIEAACLDDGAEVRRVREARDEEGVEAVIAVGYPHHFPALLARPRVARRISWYAEALPPASGAGRMQSAMRAVPSARLLDVIYDLFHPWAPRALREATLDLRERAAVEREWAANERELRQVAPAFDTIVMTSPGRVQSAARVGIASRCVPFGYHPRLAGPLVPPASGDRDIPVLMLGRDLDTRTRRARLLAKLSAALAPDVALVSVDRGFYGPRRHGLLARARVVLDIARTPANPGTVRLLLGSASGAAIVAEEAGSADPAIPGVHYLEGAAETLPSLIRELLADEPRRRRLVEASQALLSSSLSMRACLGRVLAA